MTITPLKQRPNTAVRRRGQLVVPKSILEHELPPQAGGLQVTIGGTGSNSGYYSLDAEGACVPDTVLGFRIYTVSGIASANTNLLAFCLEGTTNGGVGGGVQAQDQFGQLVAEFGYSWGPYADIILWNENNQRYQIPNQDGIQAWALAERGNTHEFLINP